MFSIVVIIQLFKLHIALNIIYIDKKLTVRIKPMI